MYREHTIGVIVPAYNEAAHVGTVLETMPAFVDRIYAVDDCSTDETWDVIQQYVMAEAGGSATEPTDLAGEPDDAVRESIADGGALVGPQIVPIRHEENQGAGGALKTGYLHAREDGVDLTVTMDADGQMDPDNMPKLLDPLVEDEADYAKGNRLANPGDWVEMPPFRLLGNWMLTVLTNVASGYWRTTDPQNGYTAITREALRSIDVEQMRDGHDYCNDLLVRLNVAGSRVADVSMPAVYCDEESTINYSSFIPTTSLTLTRGFGWRLKKRYLAEGIHPIALCYGVGFLAATIGAASGLAAIVGSIGGDSDRGGVTKSLLAVVVGLLVAVGMILDARENEDLEVRHK